MKKYKAYVVLVIVMAVVVFFLQDSDELAWLRANLGNKSTDYAQYIKSHPEGWHVLEAKKRFDEQSWKESCARGAIADFQNYIKQIPEGLHVDEANEKIASITWYQVTARNSVAGYEQFMEQFPQSKYEEQAQKNIEELAWRKAESLSTIQDVKRFIENYPHGEHLNDAQNTLDDLIWDQATSLNNKEKIQEYIELYPSGRHVEDARKRLGQMPEPWPVYIDAYHLYELTAFDKDYDYVFLNQIKEMLSKYNTIKVVSEKSDAVVHLQIGYALDFRDGQTGEDNISKFIENRWRDRAIAKQERVKPTYDLALQSYLWDIANECLLAYSATETPPEPGNAIDARIVGRDKFLDEQVKNHLANSFVPFLDRLEKGKEGVMFFTGANPTLFYRHDIGKPKRRVCVTYDNGPVTVYHWRDPSIERYIYYQLQQADIDCVRTYDDNSYMLLVTWTKYPRQPNRSSPFREYGLSADFVIYEKNKDQNDRLVFNKTITSDTGLESYGVLPSEVINKWRKSFDNSYIAGEIVKQLKPPPMNAEQE